MSDLFMNLQRKKIMRSKDQFTSISNQNILADANNNDTGYVEADEDQYEESEEVYSNVLSLKLKKPKHWKWELSTSRSCSNIALPRILLYDHKGHLLVDANSQEEQIFKQPLKEKRNSYSSSSKKHKNKYSDHRSLTSNLENSIKQALEKEFNSLQIAEVTPSPEHSSLVKNTSISSRSIDFNTYDLPDYRSDRRSSSLKETHLKKHHQGNLSLNTSFNLNNLPTPPSTSTPTGTTPSSSSTGPREKKRLRKSHSSTRAPIESPSILERFSIRKGRFSSPEYADEQEIRHSPRYYLSTSKIGTIVVKEDSFTHNRRRRRLRNSSAENLNSSSKTSSNISKGSTKIPSNDHLKPQNAVISTAPSSRSRSKTRRKQKTVHRLLSDGNFLEPSNLSSSEEDFKPLRPTKEDAPFASKRFNKRDLVRLDSGVSSAYTGR